jgi:hypothetical protein
MLRDTNIRRPLKRHLADVHAKDADTRIVDELGLRQGAVRVDVAVINGALHGYEIKSDVDTLQRLSSQVETYSDVLDEAALVTTVEHAQRDAVAMIPEGGTSSSSTASRALRASTPCATAAATQPSTCAHSWSCCGTTKR